MKNKTNPRSQSNTFIGVLINSCNAWMESITCHEWFDARDGFANNLISWFNGWWHEPRLITHSIDWRHSINFIQPPPLNQSLNLKHSWLMTGAMNKNKSINWFYFWFIGLSSVNHSWIIITVRCKILNYKTKTKWNWGICC